MFFPKISTVLGFRFRSTIHFLVTFYIWDELQTEEVFLCFVLFGPFFNFNFLHTDIQWYVPAPFLAPLLNITYHICAGLLLDFLFCLINLFVFMPI